VGAVWPHCGGRIRSLCPPRRQAVAGFKGDGKAGRPERRSVPIDAHIPTTSSERLRRSLQADGFDRVR
jgi:hypothetical protein